MTAVEIAAVAVVRKCRRVLKVLLSRSQHSFVGIHTEPEYTRLSIALKLATQNTGLSLVYNHRSSSPRFDHS